MVVWMGFGGSEPWWLEKGGKTAQIKRKQKEIELLGFGDQNPGPGTLPWEQGLALCSVCM